MPWFLLVIGLLVPFRTAYEFINLMVEQIVVVVERALMENSENIFQKLQRRAPRPNKNNRNFGTVNQSIH